MDPQTGKIYSLDDPDIPSEVRERLVPIELTDQQKKELEEAQEELRQLSEIHRMLKDHNDRASSPPPKKEKPQYLMNRADKRRLNRRKT